MVVVRAASVVSGIHWVTRPHVPIPTLRFRLEHRIYSPFSQAGHVTFPKCSTLQLPVNY